MQRRAFSVSIFARHAGRVLLIKHKRLGTWLPVGGELNPGETPLEAARRELHEETGLEGQFRGQLGVEGTPPGLIGYEEHMAGSKGLHMNFVFVADVPSDIVLPNQEFDEHRWLRDTGEVECPANVRELVSIALREQGPARAPDVAELERDSRILDTLHKNINMSVWVIDRDGLFTFQRGKALEVAGLKRDQFVGMNVFDLYTDHEGVTAIRRAFEGQNGHVVDELHGIAWEHWYIPMRDDKGEVDGVCGFTLDRTEVRRAEKDLRVQLELVERQQRVIRALSTPIIEVWDKVLTLPMLGVVDTMRASEVMENLLEQVSRKGARFAILDLTGVETVDTGTASHLLKLIQALRLLGAEGIITGIQPQVAQTMVALGMDLGDIVTLASLRDGLRLCIKRMREGAA